MQRFFESTVRHWFSVVGGGGAGGASEPPKVLISRKSGQNHSKYGQNPENPGTNGTQRCFTSRNGAQRLQKNTWRSFFGGHTKKWSFMGKELLAKIAQKNFSAKFGKIRAKIFLTPKNLPARTPVHWLMHLFRWLLSINVGLSCQKGYRTVHGSLLDCLQMRLEKLTGPTQTCTSRRSYRMKCGQNVRKTLQTAYRPCFEKCQNAQRYGGVLAAVQSSCSFISFPGLLTQMILCGE